MQGSKIRLSPAEAALFSNAELILTKNRIIQKTVSLLSEVQQEMVSQTFHPTLAHSPSPKISKGENYLGLPYVILDYPRISNTDGICFIRSMFWWGNFYSSTLQVSGEFKQKHLPSIVIAYKKLVDRDYSVGVNADPWVHHFEEDNYKPIHQLSVDAFRFIVDTQAQIKIAASWPLREWDSAAKNLLESWQFLLKLVS